VADRAGALWADFAQAKGEVGMDHYAVRTWEAWHRFITLCLLAHCLLVILWANAQADEGNDGKKGMANPG
jgi:SRSO17 transposase